MTERELSKKIVRLARKHGWKVAHFHAAMTARGAWATPVAADGKGFPDLILVRPPRLIAAELKVRYNVITDDQKDWLNLFEKIPGVEVYVWRDRIEWENGDVEEILK